MFLGVICEFFLIQRKSHIFQATFGETFQILLIGFLKLFIQPSGVEKSSQIADNRGFCLILAIKSVTHRIYVHIFKKKTLFLLTF